MRPTAPLLFVHDDADLLDARLSPTTQVQVLAFDADVHLSLAARGIEHVTPWSVIGRDGLPRLVALRDAVLREWARIGRLEHHGVNLLSLAAYRHVSCFSRLTWALYAARRAIDALRPARVLVFDEPACHGLDQPPLPRRMPMLSRVVAAAAEESGLPLELLTRQAARFHDAVAERDQTQLERIDPAQALAGRPFALFYGNGTELERQLPLVRAVRDQLGWRAVQLYKSAPPDVVARARQAGDCVWHESQVAPPLALPDIRSAAASARERFDRAARCAEAAARPLLASPWLASHYDFLFGGYARKMAWHVEAWSAWLDEHAPRALIVNYQTPLLDVAAARGIPCLALPHGLLTLGQPEQFTSLPAGVHIAAINAAHRRILLEQGIEAERIHDCCDPAADAAANEWPGQAPRSPLLNELREARARGEWIVLICTGSYGMPAANVHLPMTDWSDAVRRTRRLGGLLARRPGWRIVIKMHPRFDYPRLYAEIADAMPPSRRWTVTSAEPLAGLAAEADVICIWNVLTSAIVEASRTGRPVICANPSLVWADEVRWGTAAWPHVADEDALEQEIERLRTDPAWRQQRVNQTRAALERFLDGGDSQAVARCVATLNELSLRRIANGTSVARAAAGSSAGLLSP